MHKNLLILYSTGFLFVVATGVVVYFICLRRNFKSLSLFFTTAIILSSYMLFAQYLKYLSLHFYVDFAHWTQLLNSIAATGKPYCISQDIYIPGTLNYLSAHFVPLIFALAVPFKLWPNSETLIILNFFLMVSSAIPLYKLTLRCAGEKRFGLFMATLLLWYPTFQYIVMYEFEMLRFSIPVILWMLYFWEKKNTWMYFLFAVIAVLVREEVGLTVAMFGFYILIFNKKPIQGIVTVILGVTAFATITQIIMPALRTSQDWYIVTALFSNFGDNFTEVVINVIKHPVRTLVFVCQAVKLANVFMYFLPLLFVPLLSPSVLLAAVANFGVVLLSDSITHSSYMLYYLSPSIPFIFYAFIKAWPKLLRILRALMKKSSLNQDADVNSVAMMGVLSALLVANIFFGPSFLSLQFWFRNIRPAPFRTQNHHYSAYIITDHHRKAKEFVDIIPGSAIVSTQHFLFPPLFRKKGIMIFPLLENMDGKYKADFVFFDKTNNGLKKESPSYHTQRDFDLVEKDKGTWRLVRKADGYCLYKRIQE